MREAWAVAAPGDEARVSALVRETIEAVYPRFYPRAVVDFFLAHHEIGKIAEDILRGEVRLLTVDGLLVGTGSARGNQIRRVFVSPDQQGKGF
jgi:citrate lyase synthetase